MFRPFVETLGVRELNDLTQVHDCHPIAHIFDNTQIVRDKKKRQTELLLEVLEEIQDLGLNRRVESAYRLVSNDEIGSHGQ